MRRAVVLAVAFACGGDKARSVPDVPELGEGQLAELVATRAALLEADPGARVTLARLAEVDGLAALHYGVPVPEERVFARVPAGTSEFQSWAIGKIARELTRVDKPEQLDELDQLLATLGAHAGRRSWLAARIALARGDRGAAKLSLAGSELPAAKLDHALLLADEGQGDRALAMLPTLATDELASAIRGLLHAERGELEPATAALQAVTVEAPRITAYRLLARAAMGLANQRYELTAEALDRLGKQRGLPNECALWERIAWAHLQLGRNAGRTNDHKIAGISRLRCAALGKATGTNDRLALVDATLQLGLAKPEAALALATKIPTLWGRVTRAYALLELGRAGEVAAVFAEDRVLDRKTRPEERAARIVIAQAKGALAELDALADASVHDDQRARFALGAAQLAKGDLTAAKRELRRVVEETSPERPDPFAFRTHQLLAEIALADHDLETAGPEIERAIAIHPGNAMGYVIQARLQLRRGEPERALATMAPVRKLGELIPAGKLVVAEALATVEHPTAEQRGQARALVLEVKAALPPAEVGRVAALVDPTLPRELGLPVGKLPKQGT